MIFIIYLMSLLNDSDPYVYHVTILFDYCDTVFMLAMY